MLGKTNISTGTGGTLTVAAPAGVTCTIAKDGKTKSKVVDSFGTATFKGLSTGTWTVTISDGVQTATDTVEVRLDYTREISFAKVYGIYRDITASSPEWAREANAVAMSATATVGTVAGSSDFSDCYPWRDIVRETLDTGDVMVKIPKFWYRRYREGNVEHIQIADAPTSGFALHPAFCHSGVEQECIYVGAYSTSENTKSEKGVKPKMQMWRSVFRANAQAKGVGWGILDISTLSAIQMLYLVEFANYDTQTTIGRGVSDGGPCADTGSCDDVAGLTGRPAGTDGKVDIVWRGLEGLWGGVWEYIDGINQYSSHCYICNDPENYADDTSEHYTVLSYGHPKVEGTYATEHGLDRGNPHVLMPTAASGGSETTCICDLFMARTTDWSVAKYGGYWSRQSNNGLFAVSLNDQTNASGPNDVTGARLLYIPQ